MTQKGLTRAGLTRRLGAGVLVAAALGLTALGVVACRQPQGLRPQGGGEIAFAILSAQGQASAAPLWSPLLEDLSAAVGRPVTPRFTADYATLLDDLQQGRAQAAWLSARPAVEALDAGGVEMIARTVSGEGETSYRATLIVRRGSGVTLDDVLACGRTLSFGSGDAQSTSATLAPAAFLFNPQNIRPETCFKSVRPSNHETNAYEVASGILDVAASNTATYAAIARQNPTIAAEIETIWQSPPIPEGGVVVREDLDPAVKEKLRGLLLSYGRGDGVVAERQRRVLAGLNYSRFIAADDDYLNPVRELIADQALTAARASGDRAAANRAERTLESLRASREVQP